MLKVLLLTNSKMFKPTFVKADVKHRNVGMLSTEVGTWRQDWRWWVSKVFEGPLK
jgi:hypothetical protein